MTSSESSNPLFTPSSSFPSQFLSLYRNMSTPLIPFLRRDEPSSRDSPYGYLPAKWVCVLFIALFSCTSLVHIAQAVRYRCTISFSMLREGPTQTPIFFHRMWLLLSTVVICGIGEAIGWSGRLWTSYNPTRDEAFYMG